MNDDDDEWVGHVLNELVPMLQDSEVVASFVPDGETDVKFALETGLAIMLDKPIILVVGPGVRVPAKLLRVADAVVEGDMSTEQGRQSLLERLKKETARVLGD